MLIWYLSSDIDNYKYNTTQQRSTIQSRHNSQPITINIYDNAYLIYTIRCHQQSIAQIAQPGDRRATTIRQSAPIGYTAGQTINRRLPTTPAISAQLIWRRHRLAGRRLATDHGRDGVAVATAIGNVGLTRGLLIGVNSGWHCRASLRHRHNQARRHDMAGSLIAGGRRSNGG